MVTEGDKRPMKSLPLSLFGALLFLALSLIPAAATSHCFCTQYQVSL